MAGKNYYKTLGVEKNASAEEIKKAFRKLAHEHHPDKTGGDDKHFKEISEAYQVLGNAEKRQQYDQFGSTFEDMNGGQGFGQGFHGFQGFNQADFGDIGDILGSMFGGGRSHTREQSRGKDIEKDISLEFKESIFGVNKIVELYRHVSCDRCNGNGAEPGSKISDCASCHGSGEIKAVQRTVFGNFETRAVCNDCHGLGKKPEKPCIRCHGSGITRDLNKLEIKIPAGSDDGAVLRVRGEGETAAYGGASGDLYLHLHIKYDPRWQRQGSDIVSSQKINFSTAALGGTVKVETVDGPVELKIPAGTQADSVFSLRGKGIPSVRRGGRGDHLVKITIDVPKKLSKKQKQLLEQFEEES